MRITSKLVLDTAGRRPKDGPDLAVTHVGADPNGARFRNQAWIIVLHLVDFYCAARPGLDLVGDLRSLAAAILDLSMSMEGRNAQKHPTPT